MNKKLSDRIQKLSESKTIQMSRLSRELRSEGHDIINLSLGEPDFDTPLHVKEAGKKAIDEGFTKYPPVSGFDDLKEAIIGKFKRDNHLNFKKEQIVVSTGAKQSLANIMLSLLNPGDEVILPAPYWVSYAEMIKLAEGKVIPLKTTVEKNFKASSNQIKEAVSDKTRMILFSSPCNPTGTVYSSEDFQAWTEVLKEHPDIVIVADEIYEYINFGKRHYSISEFEEIRDQLVIVNGVSKGFAMTGWRLGYMAAPEWIAAACDKMQGQFTSGACSISQKAAKEALAGPLDATKEMRKAFKIRRDLVQSMLKKIPGVKVNSPQGAFYIFPDFSYYLGKTAGEKKMESVDDLCMYLLTEAKVSVVTGSAFGDHNCIRISYASSEKNLKEALRRIESALKKIR